jgi:U6 snRNA-associated Sm-like protein LSm2
VVAGVRMGFCRTLRSWDGTLRGTVRERVLIAASILLQQSSVKNVFIRGSVVRYVHLPANAVDTPLLEDATRRGTKDYFRMSRGGEV